MPESTRRSAGRCPVDSGGGGAGGKHGVRDIVSDPHQVVPGPRSHRAAGCGVAGSAGMDALHRLSSWVWVRPSLTRVSRAMD